MASWELGVQLWKSSWSGNLEKVKELVEWKQAPVNYQKKTLSPWQPTEYSTLSTPIWISAWFGHKRVVEYLLKNGADPSIQNSQGYNAFWAAENGGSDRNKEIRRMMESKSERTTKPYDDPPWRKSLSVHTNQSQGKSTGKNILQTNNQNSSTKNKENSHSNEDVLNIPESSIEKGIRIGDGGSSIVYKGKWMSLIVAIKELNRLDESSEKVRNEIAILSKLRHPRIVLFLGVCISEHKCMIILEYMENLSLYHQLHTKKKKLKHKEIFKIASEVAEGMLYLHKLDILHCDLKTKNILLCQNGAKISDFGLSKILNPNQTSVSYHGLTFGSVAPEVLRGGKIRKKSDVYSYGVALWEMVTGSIPWGEYSIYQIISSVGGSKRLEIPNDCDPTLASIMKECFGNNRPTFEQIRNILERSQTGNSMGESEEEFDLFLSHTHVTAEKFARMICEKAASWKMKAFLDVKHDSLKLHNLENIIKNSHVFVLLITKDVLRSKYVRMEIEAALKFKKPCILIHDKMYCQFPSKEELPKQIRPILDITAIPYVSEYHDEFFQKLHQAFQRLGLK